MSFFSMLFAKSPSELLAKGDRYMASDSYFEARTCYEDGMQLCSDDEVGAGLKVRFAAMIDEANRNLAVRNIHEAECAYSRGDTARALDHLELVKTLTYDPVLREKAENLILEYGHTDTAPGAPLSAASCASCSGSSCNDPAENGTPDDSLPQSEYYELLIQQLPTEEYHRYASLGENFAYAYIAASRDLHHDALSGLEKCAEFLPQDIYRYEKGKILHRLGNDREAELHFRAAIHINNTNSLAWLALALLLSENHHFQDALATIDEMVAGKILVDQSLLLRAELLEVTGDHEAAVNQYAGLLQTPFARPAAEKLYGLLTECGRHDDAAVIFKKYLNKTCH